MKCPACSSHHTLQVEASPESMRIRRCPSCRGCWVRSDDYWRWKSRRDDEPSQPETREMPSAGESEAPSLRFCPEDGYVLARFEVGPPHAFFIDQCRNCSGVWLDPGEWEALSGGGLSNRLHLILSEEWQDELQASRREAEEGERWRRRLGDADLARISEIKAWLDEHPKRGQLYAYLRFHERAL